VKFCIDKSLLVWHFSYAKVYLHCFLTYGFFSLQTVFFSNGKESMVALPVPIESGSIERPILNTWNLSRTRVSEAPRVSSQFPNLLTPPCHPVRMFFSWETAVAIFHGLGEFVPVSLGNWLRFVLERFLEPLFLDILVLVVERARGPGADFGQHEIGRTMLVQDAGKHSRGRNLEE